MKQFSKPMSIVLGFALLVAALSLVPVSLISVPQDTRPPGVRVSGVYEGQLLTSGDKIYARVPPESIGVEFLLQPETIGDVRIPAIMLGTDYGHMEPTFGPDCGGASWEPQRARL